MKTFKQLMEELPKPVTPKQMDVIKSDTRFIGCITMWHPLFILDT